MALENNPLKPEYAHFLTSVLDELDIGMAFLDQDGAIQWTNHHLGLWFQADSQMLQDPCGFLCTHNHAPCCIKTAYQTREKTACEFQHTTPTGETRFYLVTIYPLKNITEPAYNAILLLHDVTEARQEAFEARRMETLQEAIYQIAAASTSVESLDEMYATLHSIIRSIMPADNFYIALRDVPEGKIHFPYFADEKDPRPNYSLPVDNTSITGYVLRTGKSLLCTKSVSNRLSSQGLVDMYGPEPEIWLGVPLIVEDQSIGVMAVQHYTDPEAYTEREKKLLEFVSTEVAKVILTKRSEKARQDGERRFRNIVEETPMGFHQYALNADDELIFLFSNKAGNNNLRENCQQYTGLPIEQAFPVLAETDLPKIYRNIALHGGVWQEQVTQMENGKLEAVFELFAFQTTPNQMAVLIQNITERLHTEKALIENEKRIRNIIEASPLGLFIFHLTSSQDLFLVEANPSSSKILKVDCQQMVGRTLIDNFPNLRTTRLPDILSKLAQEGGIYSNKQLSYKDAQIEGAFELYGFQISPSRIAVMFQDVTDRLLQEVRIKELNESLEVRVQQRTAELEAFAYSVSHDLRAPVRAIQGFAEMISQDTQNAFSEETLDLLKRILESGRKMDTLINDLLSLSHLGSQRINIRLVNLSDLARGITRRMREEHPKNTVTIQIDDTPDILADRSQVEIMLTNLLSNAFKFSRRQKNPAIHFGAAQTAGQVEFFLQDNGIGFEMEYRDKIFTPFERLNPTEYEGTGIGLAIVQRVVQQHKGHIRVSSIPGEGATFYFSFPEDPQ